MMVTQIRQHSYGGVIDFQTVERWSDTVTVEVQTLRSQLDTLVPVVQQLRDIIAFAQTRDGNVIRDYFLAEAVKRRMEGTQQCIPEWTYPGLPETLPPLD